MLEVFMWGALGIFCGVAGASFVQGFVEARKRNQHAPKQTLLETAISSASSRDTQPEIMVKLIPAVNGRLLEVSTKKVSPHHHGHYDWDHEMFIIEEGQTLSDAIAKAMLMKGLTK